MFEIKESKINGQGLFILYDVERGTLLFYVREGDKLDQRTIHTVEFEKKHYDHPTLRYANHSSEPNMYMDENGRFVAMTDLKKGDELTFDYRSTEKRFVNKFEGL